MSSNGSGGEDERNVKGSRRRRRFAAERPALGIGVELCPSNF